MKHEVPASLAHVPPGPAGASLPGRSEVFVRVVGTKPNGYLWPTLVKFTTSRVEVWIQQLSTGEVHHYELPGLFDRNGFLPD